MHAQPQVRPLDGVHDARPATGAAPAALNPFHRRLVLMAGLGWMFDAMDLGLVSFVLAGLARDWGLRPSDRLFGLPWLPLTGLVLSAGFLGMVAGALIAGTLADRFGRKRVFEATLLIYSAATGLAALVPG